MGRRRPGLLGAVARTAVVAGTASATVNAVNNRSSRRQQQAEPAQEQPAQAQQAQAQPVPDPSAAGAGDDDMVAKLKQLADLKASGVLDDAEFTAAKAKLLGT